MSESFAHLPPLSFPPIPSLGVEASSERRDAAAHRRHVLAAARMLFAQHGVEAVSMHQVAQAAGVGQGTLYRRYAHKGLLCTAILGEDIERFQAQVQATLEEMGEHTSALARLQALLDQLLRFTEAHAPLLSAIAEGTGSERGQSEYQSPLYQWLRQVVFLLLQRAVERREIRAGDLEYQADLVLLPLSIDFYRYQRQRPGFTSERIAAGLSHFLSQGLGVF